MKTEIRYESVKDVLLEKGLALREEDQLIKEKVLKTARGKSELWPFLGSEWLLQQR